jgi:hypothetical protein
MGWAFIFVFYPSRKNFHVIPDNLALYPICLPLLNKALFNILFYPVPSIPSKYEVLFLDLTTPLFRIFATHG